MPDDRLQLMFTCCHPALPIEARAALTPRTLAGLTTPEIARAFLVDEKAMAQRIVCAKRKTRNAVSRTACRRRTCCPSAPPACSACSLWNHATIDEAVRLLPPGRWPYRIQAATAAEHATGGRAADTDWARIAGLYGELAKLWAAPARP